MAQWVVCSDAWFWSWTGTTTFPPTVDHEGSGSPAGSGEQPTVDKVAAEIIDEGHGIHTTVQTWDGTTPLLTTVGPTTQEGNDRAPERAKMGISSRISKPGNGTSSLKGKDSEAFDHLKFTGNAAELRSGLQSELADTGSGLWSDSGFSFGLAAGTETLGESGFETQRFSKENLQEALRGTDHGGLDSELSQINEFQNSDLIIQNRTDERPSLGSIDSNSLTEIHSATSRNRKPNNKFELSHENSIPRVLPSHNEGKLSEDIAVVFKDNQQVEVTQLPAGESTATQEIQPTDVPQTTQASFVTQVFPTTQTPIITEKVLISKLQTGSNRPDTTIPTTTQEPDYTSTTRTKTVAPHQISHVFDATQTPVSEEEPTQETLFTQTVLDRQVPAEIHTEVAKSAQAVDTPQCLLLDAALPFCSTMVGERFTVPNFLNQSSVEEVQALLNQWVWLLKSNCHHSLEWFFCLLLVPKCGPPGSLPVLPCQSFCEVLRDSCWTLLDEGHLPVECHTLPDDEDDGYQCLSVSNQKGNHWFK